MDSRRRSRLVCYLLYGATAVVVLLWTLKPFNDPDFFWHLKTGEWIWQHRELPTRDPFAFTNESVEPSTMRFTLQSYWLSQVLYHAIHHAWGIPGIVALKLLLGAGLLALILAPRSADPVVHAALTLAVVPLLFGLYHFDRPNAFSFLLFAALLVCLERERTAGTAPAGWRSYLPIPLIMLAWANMHGGHVLGQVTIALYLVLEGVKFAHPLLQPAGRDRYRRLLIVGGAGLAASLLNPNSWHGLPMSLLVTGASTSANQEFLSTVKFFRYTGQRLLFIFWGALALAALSCLVTIRRPDITRIALLAGTGLAGFFYMRFVPFFVIAAVPAIAVPLSAARIRNWAPVALTVGALVLAASFFSWGNFPTREVLGATLRVNEAQYPVRAADFIVANDLRGNLYNTWAWGGYLLWRLAPERKVFVDGRGLNMSMNYLASSIALAMPQPPTSPLYWKNNLRQYDVRYLIVPNRRDYFMDGADGLKAALREAPEWVPVFADRTALVYVLNTPENYQVIARHALR